MVQASLSESEMRTVQQARAQSRNEIAEVERLKQQLRAAYLSRADASEEAFV